MKSKKARAQREEVRKILQTMRLELAAQRVAQERASRPEPTLRINKLFTRAKEAS